MQPLRSCVASLGAVVPRHHQHRASGHLQHLDRDGGQAGVPCEHHAERFVGGVAGKRHRLRLQLNVRGRTSYCSAEPAVVVAGEQQLALLTGQRHAYVRARPQGVLDQIIDRRSQLIVTEQLHAPAAVVGSLVIRREHDGAGAVAAQLDEQPEAVAALDQSTAASAMERGAGRGRPLPRIASHACCIAATASPGCNSPLSA